MERKGLLIILSSPSGAGKSTLSNRVLQNDSEVVFSVSATTRSPRKGEVDGREYYFKTRDEFKNLIENNGMLEHAEVFGNFYGSPRAPVEAAIEAGKDVLFDVDWQGGQQIRNSALQQSVVSIFILPPSIASLRQRLLDRGQDSAEVVEKRMAQSRNEISHWAEYDYVLINDDLDRAESELRSIVAAERLRRERQTGLNGFVQQLNAEFEAL
ncbi:MAG: guanylate kinase [Rhodobacteraceae bacterium]|nr:guanylate kinase [Paracoccaceae bacterium]